LLISLTGDGFRHSMSMSTLCAVLGGRVDKRVAGSGRVRRDPRAWGRTPWLVGGALLVIAGGLTAWLLMRGGDGPDPRARVYTAATACLLTPEAGVQDKAAAPVWAGMQQASLATNGKVSYLEVSGPQTGANAASYLGTVSVGGCDLVLVAGPAPIAALDASAGAYPKVRFVSVGGGKAQANVSVITADAPAAITEKVRALVSDALTDGGD
jgi:hypothetical protein